MQRPQLEHILRAAFGITGADRFVVIGSQSVLGQFPDPPAELLVSVEADLFTFRGPQDADLIDGSIGEASPFHQTFGYYAHGVGEETAVLPGGCFRSSESALFLTLAEINLIASSAPKARRRRARNLPPKGKTPTATTIGVLKAVTGISSHHPKQGKRRMTSVGLSSPRWGMDERVCCRVPATALRMGRLWRDLSYLPVL